MSLRPQARSHSGSLPLGAADSSRTGSHTRGQEAPPLPVCLPPPPTKPQLPPQTASWTLGGRWQPQRLLPRHTQSPTPRQARAPRRAPPQPRAPPKGGAPWQPQGPARWLFSSMGHPQVPPSPVSVPTRPRHPHSWHWPSSARGPPPPWAPPRPQASQQPAPLPASRRGPPGPASPPWAQASRRWGAAPSVRDPWRLRVLVPCLSPPTGLRHPRGWTPPGPAGASWEPRAPGQRQTPLHSVSVPKVSAHPQSPSPAPQARALQDPRWPAPSPTGLGKLQKPQSPPQTTAPREPRVTGQQRRRRTGSSHLESCHPGTWSRTPTRRRARPQAPS